MIYGLATGGEHRDFSPREVLVPILLGAVLVTAFVARALTARHPLIDLSLFRRRSFATAAGTLLLFTCAHFGSMLLPLYYQLVRGQSATGSGLLGIPQVLATGITVQIAGRMIDKVAPAKLVTAGIVLASAGFLTFTTQFRAVMRHMPRRRNGLTTSVTIGGSGST
ncbi:hypothetical protein ACRYCC_30675 [Actinomadura scrupuli]|uniref:hypothetical protein n=1 Tax=Actinomadura scrupuli TaxID=559629 RepID=UPI003D98A159